ncbi:MAG: DnaJ domain-containing protein [Proteobacteria bacterium]|nr:DnaJ domain-containing protein [Pseudomonadota bacterium]
MKLDSKYFDSIRVSSKRQQSAKQQTRAPVCQWKGCDRPGPHKAPKGRGRDGEYFHFCIDHVRQYNQEYNYFDGMSDAEVSNFRKDAMTGHRPTWKTGANAWAHGTRDGARSAEAEARVQATARTTRKFRSSRTETSTFRRQLKPLERKSLRVLDLGDEASREDIKTRFKELVKIHHPDANGGDSRSEEKLREILQAYNYLKQSGLV